MADLADLAKEREEANREAALAAFRARARPTGESAYFCRSCGERIPDERRAAVPGTNHCTFCAQQITAASPHSIR
ncbi:TraR/DksA C4-type zinc finger protein [Paramagnetospirillum magneticum]|uniref:DnaK suppressor protein n=1 Tax=Paramagnetospirillum magneticum (strain ATCC 700264 / AMB-1) TaxID=342108 RepID=Q2WA51_PARM1|nr:TraR/DksA C4-type zinc finger protein [Paramagnetospirillum magneticum]BAE49274.1 DnaK suppressor protein [Paramagnetospirillum magneticum AMB-1]